MSKAILVMEMPERCEKCKFNLNYPSAQQYCYIQQVAHDEVKPDWCPLKQVLNKEILRLAEEYNNVWIQCSERLPERNKDVLCWVKSKTISGTETYIIGSCDNGFWFLKTYEIDRESFPVKDYEVVAWQQLPEPYKESENE